MTPGSGLSELRNTERFRRNLCQYLKIYGNFMYYVDIQEQHWGLRTTVRTEVGTSRVK